MDSLVHLRLDASDEVLDASNKWGYVALHRQTIEQVNHKAVFSRVDPLSSEEIPFPTAFPGPNDIVHRLKLISHVRYTNLYDVYKATLVSENLEVDNHDVMIKFMTTNRYGPGTDFDPPEKALETAFGEAALFEQHLTQIKDGSVPEYYGLFSLSLEDADERYGCVLIMVLEDISELPHDRALEYMGLDDKLA